MSKSNKFYAFTDCDLDGAGAYHLLSKLTGRTIPYTTARVTDVGNKIMGWLENNRLEDYERVYILDLDISQYPEVQKAVDHTNVTVIDHHKTHIDNRNKYQNAEVFVTKATSTCKLVYKHFGGAEKLSAELKLLTLMIDDYDSYKFNVPNSYELNIVFWSYQGDRVQKFIDDFGEGFVDFSSQQKNIIHFYLKKLENIKSSLDVHTAVIPVKKKKYKFVAVFADTCINDIATHIIQNYKSDIGLVVNLRTNKVSLRRSKTCTLDLSQLAQTLFEEGGGHEDASGGIICDKFMLFTKLFKPMKIKQF